MHRIDNFSVTQDTISGQMIEICEPKLGDSNGEESRENGKHCCQLGQTLDISNPNWVTVIEKILWRITDNIRQPSEGSRPETFRRLGSADSKHAAPELAPHVQMPAVLDIQSLPVGCFT